MSLGDVNNKCITTPLAIMPLETPKLHRSSELSPAKQTDQQ